MAVTEDDDEEPISSPRRGYKAPRDFQGPLRCRTSTDGQNHRVEDASVENDDEDEAKAVATRRYEETLDS